MELVELVHGAQDAMDRGDYRLATTASAHGLAAYPSCLAAHRILGEAYLELGSTDPATTHFERTIAVDPLNVVARLGLGVASEEQKDYGAAYAHYLHAWEINPALDQVRDELVRLRTLLGAEDRLRPTRAGLAGIHARGGQLFRAANEWRAILAVEPESRRALTSFVELLWRQGEDGPAAVACRDALRGSPENARALAILADIERRRGVPGADELAERYRAVDPTGDVLKLLSEWRPDVDLSFLATESALVDDFDFAAHAVPVDQLGAPPKITTNALAGNQIAAPDLWDTLVKDLSSDIPASGVAPTLAAGVEPFAWNDGAPDQSDADPFAALGIQPFNVNDLGRPGDPVAFSFGAPETAESGLSTAEPGPSTADIYTAALSKDAASAFEPDAVSYAEPASDDDDLALLFAPSADREIADATPPAPAADAGSLWEGSGGAPQAVGGALAGYADLAALGIEPFSFDGMPESVAPITPDVALAAPFAPLPPAALSSPPPLDPVVPAMPTPASISTTPVCLDPFVGADGEIDLTAGWDELDKRLAAAKPSLEAVGRYDDLAAELDLNGIVPFDADIPDEDDDAWAPLTDDDLGLTATADRVAVPPAVLESEVVFSEQSPASEADLLAEYLGSAVPEPSHETEASDQTESEPFTVPPTFDDAVNFGIPSQQSSSYPELLHHVELLDVVEDRVAEMDPFSNPDTSGDPLAFEDLLAVTNRDGTAAGDLVVSSELRDLDLGDVHPLDLDCLAEMEPTTASMQGSRHDVGSADSDEPAEDQSDGAVEPFAFDALDVTPIDDPTSASAGMAPPAHPELAPFEVETMIAIAEPARGVPESVATAAAEPPPEPVESESPAPDWSGSGGLGMPIGSVVWPAFVNRTSGLIDRDRRHGSVFARLRASKSALVAAGGLTVDRWLVAPAPPAPVTDAPAATAQVAEVPVEVTAETAGTAEGFVERRRPRPEMSAQTRLDLMAMRVRLIEDADAAEEVAATVEKAVGEGLTDPLALRILGEAYLKLGRMEEAAAQFR